MRKRTIDVSVLSAIQRTQNRANFEAKVDTSRNWWAALHVCLPYSFDHDFVRIEVFVATLRNLAIFFSKIVIIRQLH